MSHSSWIPKINVAVQLYSTNVHKIWLCSYITDQSPKINTKLVFQYDLCSSISIDYGDKKNMKRIQKKYILREITESHTENTKKWTTEGLSLKKYICSRDWSLEQSLHRMTWYENVLRYLVENKNVPENGNTTFPHIVTCWFIDMIGMWEILDQCSFLLYLSSNNGQLQMISRLRESGRLSSVNDLSFWNSQSQ